MFPFSRFLISKSSHFPLVDNYKKISFIAFKCLTVYQNIHTLNQNPCVIFHQNAFIKPVGSNISLIRQYSKKKKASKKQIEKNEESESEDEEEFENLAEEEVGDDYNTITKAVPSMRIDTIIKAGLGISKKKVEKEFYASNLRLNGEKVLKKSTIITEEHEIDLVKEISPDNDKFLIVNRIIVKSIGKVTGTGNYPIKLQVFKDLTIENYAEPWRKSGPVEL